MEKNILFDDLPEIEVMRQQLREKEIKAKEFYRILHIGRYAFGKTDIVSRMKVALENLGHTVFDLNTDDFPEVVHNPDKLTGGIGPIEIKLDLIKPIIKQFEPQIIICNAGGYTFSEEDSKWIKEQGIILVGITLSDPDVFVGTKKFAHRFDYHTTNAIEALKMYEEHGIRNTFHLPFAIDRSFIETDAIERDEWKADVICIGNAFNREDRNKTMKYLANYLDVKVYGTGWELPGSFPVSGEDFFSAARAGKFHVNFPGTRAGYTNLKIGVFESIANGGILCTEIFDEMKIFFEYDKEIIGYKDPEDLKNKIEYYLNHPQEAELLRRRAFKRLIEEHLWESRWETLFEKIRTDINIKKEILDPERYNQIGTLIGNKKPAAKVIIQGYYGALNSGDDLILEAISDNLKKKHENLLIMVAGFNRKNITLKQGFYSLPRTDVFKMEKYIKDAHLLIYGGGGLLNDYTFNNSAGVADFFDSFTHGLTGMGIIPTIASIHEVPTMYFALGVGPLTNPEARRFVRFLANQIDCITVRDKHSKDLLESIEGINNEVIQTSDATYMLDFPDNTLAIEYFNKNGINSENVVTVSLREWKDNPKDFYEKFAKFLDQIAMNTNYKILFLPYQFGRGKSDDNIIHRKVYDLMSQKDKAVIYNHEGNYQEFLSIINASKIAISMRLHGSILANIVGVPSIGFNYDDKVKAHYANMNNSKYLLDLNFDPENAFELFNELLQEREEVIKKLNKRISEEKIKSSRTFELAEQLLLKGLNKHKENYKYYPRTESLRELKQNELENEMKNLKLDNFKLKNEIKVLRNTFVSKELNKMKFVNLREVVVNTQDGPNTDVIVRKKYDELGIRLSKLDAPKKGDFTTASIEIEADSSKKYLVSLGVNSPYYKPKNKGRIVYFVRINGKTVFKEDIAVNNEEVVINHNVKPKNGKIKIEFTVSAIKNCENWNWGSVSKCYLTNLSVIEMEKKRNRFF